MSHTPWWKTLIAGACAVAVGLGCFAIALTLRPAPAGEAQTSPDTRIVPVIAPSAFGPVPPEAVTEIDENGTAIAPEDEPAPSPVIGTALVPAEAWSGEEGAIDPALREHLDGILAADDPAEAEERLLLEPAPPGDGCASGADGCPEGVAGRILALTSPPPLRLELIPDPSMSGICEGVSEHGTHLGIVSSTPGRFTAVVTRSLYPDEVLSELEIATDPDAAVHWHDALGWASSESEVRPVRHCLSIPDLEYDREYRVQVTAVDDFSRVAVARTALTRQMQDGRPPARIYPVGSTTVVASIAIAPGERAEIRALLIDPEAPAPIGDPCDARGTPLRALTSGEISEITQDYLRRNDYHRDFDRRSTSSFEVPDAAQALICARALPRFGASWEQDTPLYQASQTISFPDLTLPIVTLNEVVVPAAHNATPVAVEVSFANGEHCGRWQGVGGSSGDRVVCRPLPSGASHSDVIVTARGTVAGQEYALSSYLPLSALACLGWCETAPETTWYHIQIPAAEPDPARCAEADGRPCTPLGRGESAGYALLKVDWTHGNRTGLGDIVLGDIQEGRYVDSEESPRFDTNEWPKTRLSPENNQAEIALLVRSQRPADFVLRVPEESCAISAGIHSAAIREVRGQTGPDGVTATLAGLCRGAHYLLEVTLTDSETGAERTWTYGREWYRGAIETPNLEVSILGDYRLRSTETNDYPVRQAKMVVPFAFRLKGTTLDTLPEGYCVDRTVERALDPQLFALDEHPLMHLSFRMPWAFVESEEGPEGGLRCPYPLRGLTYPLSVHDYELDLERMLTGGGILIQRTNYGLPWEIYVRLRAVPMEGQTAYEWRR